MSILIIYRPPYSKGNPYKGFNFVKEFGDFLGDRLNNTSMIMEDFEFHVENSETLAFQGLLQSFGLIQCVDCQIYQSGHTLDLIIAKEKDSLCISHPVEKFYTFDHCFVHKGKQSTDCQKNYKDQMRVVEGKEIKRIVDRGGDYRRVEY